VPFSWTYTRVEVDCVFAGDNVGNGTTAGLWLICFSLDHGYEDVSVVEAVFIKEDCAVLNSIGE